MLSGAFLFVIYVLASCSGLYLLKTAQAWMTTAFLGGAVLYGFGAVVWLLILRVYPLSIAFPVASGALIIGTTLVGFFILKESISGIHFVGIVLIIFGIGLLTLKMK